MAKTINSYQELEAELAIHHQLYLFLFKHGSDQSNCAFNELEKAHNQVQNVQLLIADVNEVRDIHPAYGVTSVPVLIEFENTHLKNITKGCQSASYYELLFMKKFKAAEPSTAKNVQKNVKVYSTPTCSWCNTLKRYLDEHGIRYSDIDVSKDQKQADQMVKRSGQQGVPQTDINGTIIVGFDKNKIDQLLNLHN